MQNGEIHDTFDEVPLVFDNIVVLEVAYKRSQIDPDSVDAETVGSGVLNLLIGGKRHEGIVGRATRGRRPTASSTRRAIRSGSTRARRG